ncbi:hypothetical protein [Kineococcus esterisolvens]|uniref:hypothetical protein n=1 Tax=unclassified Kineococcus TaxID=2621656 RepID=UPI003D7E0BA3
MIELLLPAVWDQEYAYGMEMPNRPDPDMPRTPSDPKKGGTLFAHLADIRRAWERADLTDAQRRVLLLRYGLDWKWSEIAYNQRADSKSVRERADRALTRIAVFLNGPDWLTEFEPAPEDAPLLAAA